MDKLVAGGLYLLFLLLAGIIVTH
ncbi:hypothetical protein CampHawk_220 [Bacillus phage CampHawk]|uniref:Uncharacterized protein n=1 Tax=Bacillus phage CampHawk TaxID=1406783 RepID=U5PWC2_9CAUD|nr:transcriptional regulator [Bacillus phage CampHawk]YP_008770154.1 transcriptional regulator [Bacillus phage CampHawk]AGY46897.1 hypothetical protein CampHawk_19 [Bacillus phage CampHawk]AGY47098.1 hypothetical protein CampHawk_220 [Bacillus phage CampHawk]